MACQRPQILKLVAVYGSRVIECHVEVFSLPWIQVAAVEIDGNHQTITTAFSVNTARLTEVDGLSHQLVSDPLPIRIAIPQVEVKIALHPTTFAREAVDRGVDTGIELLHCYRHIEVLYEFV